MHAHGIPSPERSYAPVLRQMFKIPLDSPCLMPNSFSYTRKTVSSTAYAFSYARLQVRAEYVIATPLPAGEAISRKAQEEIASSFHSSQ